MKRSTISSNARSLIGIAVMAVLSLAVIAVSDPLLRGLDPSHIALTGIGVQLDSQHKKQLCEAGEKRKQVIQKKLDKF